MDIDYENIVNKRLRNEVRTFLGERVSLGSGISRHPMFRLMNGAPVNMDGIILTNVVNEQNSNKRSTSLYLRFLDSEKTSKEIKLSFLNEYPFRPPVVYIGNVEYFSLLADLGKHSMWKFIPGNIWNKKNMPTLQHHYVSW